MYTNPQKLNRDDTKLLRKEAGAWLRTVRERQKLTQFDVAQFMEYRYYTQYTAVEYGVGRVPPDRTHLLAAALGIPAYFAARKLMRFYDPETFAILFDESEVDDVKLELLKPLGKPVQVPVYSNAMVKARRAEGGRFIKSQREMAGLTQADVADALGYKFYTRVSQIERGVGRVPPEDYMKYAEALRIESSHFVRDLVYFYDPVTYYLAFHGAPRNPNSESQE